MRRRYLGLLLLPAILALVGAAVLILWLGLPRTSINRVADLPVLVREIQQLSELVSVKYTVQKVVGLEEKKVLFGSEKLLLIVQAEVLAGVDLSEVTTDDVRRSSDERVTITLPPPKILHVVLDEERTKVWDRQITWWTPWVPFNPDLERQARLAALDSVRESAIEMGILDDARRNAEETIRSLLRALGGDSVVFERES